MYIWVGKTLICIYIYIKLISQDIYIYKSFLSTEICVSIRNNQVFSCVYIDTYIYMYLLYIYIYIYICTHFPKQVPAGGSQAASNDPEN